MAKLQTLVLLVRDNTILLAMKKRGFGAGKWNGIGGKVEAGETIEQAMIRETQEEIEVTPTDYHKVAIHTFTFANGEQGEVHTYICTRWEGEPSETDEMAPQWFNRSDIPYKKMWQDDIVWLPKVLAGNKLTTQFSFDKDDNMLDSAIEVVPTLPEL